MLSRGQIRKRIKINKKSTMLFCIVVSLVMAIIGATKFPTIITAVGIGTAMFVHLSMFLVVRNGRIPPFLEGLLEKSHEKHIDVYKNT